MTKKTSTTDVNASADDVQFGRFHASGARTTTDKGLDLLSLPTSMSQRLGVEQLKAAHEAGDRLATCVLGMCAIEGVGIEADAKAGMKLLEEAACQGSHLAENYIARYLLSRWSGADVLPTDGLSRKQARRVAAQNAKKVREHREETRRVWCYLRGPILRGVVDARRYPALLSIYDEIMWRDEVSDSVELDVCMVFGALGNARASYLAALAYNDGRAGVSSLTVAARLMMTAMRQGNHDALIWVRFARRAGKIA